MLLPRRYRDWLLLTIGAPLSFAASPTTISTPLLLNPPAVGGKPLIFSSTVNAFLLGEITFVDGVATRPQPIGSNGVVEITQAFTIGTHTISALYVDDSLIPVYLPFSSGTLNQVVDKTATVLEMDYTAGQLIQPVIIRATPIVPNPVGGAPFPVAGTVDFANGGLVPTKPPFAATRGVTAERGSHVTKAFASIFGGLFGRYSRGWLAVHSFPLQAAPQQANATLEASGLQVTQGLGSSKRRKK